MSSSSLQRSSFSFPFLKKKKKIKSVRSHLGRITLRKKKGNERIFELERRGEREREEKKRVFFSLFYYLYIPGGGSCAGHTG
jgi:hypothetical protein